MRTLRVKTGATAARTTVRTSVRTAGRLPFILAGALALLLPAAAAAQEATVRGTVRDARALPLSFAEVLVDDSVRARTDSAGRFELAGLRAGEIELTVRRVGFAPVSVPLTLAPGRVRTLVVELAALSYALDPVIVSASRPGLFGQVVDVTGAPIADAEVLVAGADPVRTAGDGGFAVTGLPPRSYLVTVRREGHYAAHFSVTLPADRGQEVRVELEALPWKVTGGARRLASGFSPRLVARRRELGRRMEVNAPVLVPRSTLAEGGKRDIAEVLRNLTLQALPAAELPSHIPSRVTETPGADAAPAVTPRTSPPVDRFATPDGDGACYFVDGEWPTDQMPPRTIPTSWIEMVEISRRDDTGTLRGRLPLEMSARDCRLWIVLWLRR